MMLFFQGLLNILYIFLFFISNIHIKSYIISKRHDRTRFDSIKSSNNNMGIDLSARIKKGSISTYEINRMFKLTRTQLDKVNRPLATGYSGIIIGLESCMLDLSSTYGYSFAILASDLNQATPDPILVRDLLGSTFKDYIIGLGIY